MSFRSAFHCEFKSDIYSTPAPDGIMLYVECENTFGDVPPQLWQYDVNSSATDDYAGGVVMPTIVTGNGRWLRRGVFNYQPNWNETDTSSPAYINNKPSIPAPQVNSDWNSSSGLSQILNKPTIPIIPGTNTFSAYSAGTAYTLTTSSAKVDFGTTDPEITITKAGIYLILTNIKIEYAGLTTALNTCNFKLRRTNNSPTDLTGATTNFNVPALTLATGTGGDVDIAPIIYTTANNNDNIQLWGNRSGGLTLGSINVGEAAIVAVRIA